VRRLCAFGVDLLTVSLVFGCFLLVGKLAGFNPSDGLFVYVTTFVALGACFCAIVGMSVWLTDGQSVGKAMFGLTVRRLPPARLRGRLQDLAWALARHSWGYMVVDVAGVGCLVVLLTRHRRSLHDYAFHSEVVYVDRPVDESLSVSQRGKEFVEAVQSGIERSQQENGWIGKLSKWSGKIIIAVGTVVFALAKFAKPLIPTSKPHTSIATATNAGSHATTQTAVLLVSTTIATTGLAVAVAPPPNYANINITAEFGTVGQSETDEIYLMHADGTHFHKLTANSFTDDSPSLFHDRRIVFVSDRDGDNNIYVMNVNGTAQTRLTTDPATDDCPPGHQTAARSPSIAIAAATTSCTS
jgi:uncharacterized RDD family membrane protein YckC